MLCFMTIKDLAIRTIEQLPENASWEDIQERINFIAGVRKGLKELDEGRGIPHDRVKEEFAESGLASHSSKSQGYGMQREEHLMFESANTHMHQISGCAANW